MEKKSKLIELASGIGKTARDLLDNAVQSVDQNDDGKFDFEDVSAMAESVGNTVEKGTLAFIESAKEKARLLELKILQPIFTDTLDSVDFSMPKFIRITARDKKYAESEVCKDSIGYLSDQKDLHFITICFLL